MATYLINRFLLLVPTVFLVSVAIFVLLRAVPGDAIFSMLSSGESGEGALGSDVYAQLRSQYGLDRPLWEQYLTWALSVLRGDWGKSIYSSESVFVELARRLPTTAELATLTLFISMAIGIPVGVLSAVRQGSFLDYLGRISTVAFLSMPNFWLGTLIILVPAMVWRYFPPVTYVSPFEDPLSNLRQFLPPALALGAQSSAVVARMTRSTMLEVLRQDYIRTAWAKGLRGSEIHRRHALKNALIPVITIAGLQFGSLLGGTVIIESLFGLPGLGQLALAAIQNRDYPQVQANVVIFACVYVVINLMVDLAYGWLDPRIRYG